MRILWLTTLLPSPTTGSQARQFNLIRQLCARHDITVLSFAQDLDRNYARRLQEYCEQVVTVPLAPARPRGPWAKRIGAWRQSLLDPRPAYASMYPMGTLGRHVEGLLAGGRFDCVSMQLLRTTLLLDRVGDMPVVFTNHNVESRIQRRAFACERRITRKIQLAIEWLKLSRFEARQLRQLPVIVAVSHIDALVLARLAPGSQVRVVPNGVDTAWFAPSRDACRSPVCRVLFVGAMSYTPNVDAVMHFCREIWPRIAKRVPNAVFTIVGPEPPPHVLALSSLPRVEVTGFVEDTRPYLWSSAVSVVPLRIGSGTRLKILEAMAACLPVVSTQVGAEGLLVRDGEHLLIRDGLEAFADGVLELLTKRRSAGQLATRARALVEARYDWAMIAHELEAVYESVVREYGSSVPEAVLRAGEATPPERWS